MATPEQIRDLVSKMPSLDNPEEPVRKEGQEQRDFDQERQRYRFFKGKLTGPSWDEAVKIYDEILDGGKDAVVAVIDMLKENDHGGDYKPRYVIAGLAAYVCRPEQQKNRAAVVAALASRVNGDQPTQIRRFLIDTLRICGTPSANPALARALLDEDLADPASRALAGIGGDAGAHLRSALKSAGPKSKLAIVQALGLTGDDLALDVLATMARDPEEGVRLAALWGIARIGSPKSVDVIIRAAGPGEGFEHNQTNSLALIYAENLAASGKTTEARRVYQHLRATRDEEPHVKDAAERALTALN